MLLYSTDITFPIKLMSSINTANCAKIAERIKGIIIVIAFTATRESINRPCSTRERTNTVRLP
jgi:hypothetical protein